MPSVLSERHYHDEDAAFAYVERHVWPEGPVCPHCGGVERISRMGGKATRKGLHKCYQCRKQFTVRQGTIFESSHVPLHIWLQAIFFVAGSKKGISSNQLHRTLGVTLKTAWFMSHRIREAMRTNDSDLFGAGGGFVEADETFIGTERDRPEGARGFHHKMKVLALVDRDTGRSRAHVIDWIDTATIKPILLANISREAKLMTDEASVYKRLGGMFRGGNFRVHHASGEYVNLANRALHTNTIEGYFSIFKRGMRGIYQHCGKQHLHRYLAEFDFRYSNRQANGFNDTDRANLLLSGIVGKRLTYQRTCAR